MLSQHPIDRFGRATRGIFLFAMVACLPVTLYSYAWMIKQVYLAAPTWISVVVTVSQIITFLGIASLFDKQQERRQLSEPAQSEPPLQTKRVGPR